MSTPDWEEGYSKPANIYTKWLFDYVYQPGGVGGGALRVTLDNPLAPPDSIFNGGEIVDINTPNYQGLLVGGYTEATGEFVGLEFDSNNRLKVNAEITIQSVELEIEVDALDGDTVGVFGFVGGNTATTPVGINVTTDGAVRVVTSLNGVETISYNEVSVPDGIETVVMTYTVPLATDFQVVKVDASGDADAKFRLKKNGSILSTKRNSWANRNVDFEFSYGLKMVAGDIIEVTVEQNNGEAFDFNASFYGEQEQP